ncbi:hypothetical protein BPAE_0028g00390 [Botrytis paeoniae]|uniref:Uncharacterized protein n=1 Tax=Botrytis paeoniae TaxID=278948 RepID=A0A4Z1G364_9HELO|nr:hypothetical protein BPAE_0028g00390 [Botrytis paeoniae]
MLISPILYQKKYGAPPTPIAIIIGSHRSGLTPISAYNLANPSANASREEITAYQQSRLRGYTSQLLVDLNVFSLRSLTIPEDPNPIDPTMQRSRWVESSDLVLPISSSEKEGISWTTQDPLIWEHLQPFITPTLHEFSKPRKRTYAKYFLLNQDGRMDKAKTLQSRLERFRDLFYEINATMHQLSKTLMDYAWLFAYFQEPPEPDIEEAEYENDFEKWLDNWTEFLNKLTKALDVCLHNFNICIHRLIVWNTAISSRLYGDRCHEEEINQRINLKSFGANLSKLIELLKFIEGENDMNLQRYYNNSIDTYWASRRKLSP